MLLTSIGSAELAQHQGTEQQLPSNVGKYMPDDLADIMKIGPESHHLLIGQLRNHLFVKLGGEMDTIPDGDPDDGGHQQKVNGKLRDGKIQILFEMPDTVEIGYSKKRQCKNRKKQLKNRSEEHTSELQSL